jgi:DNA-binding PadR family transcriptional regulator
MRLKPPAYLLLGMLRLGATSGYAIKKTADVSTRFFWPTSLAQVYPELSRLEDQGLVSRRDDSHGARARSAYSITPEGEDALLAWLRSEREAPVQLRDEGLLRLFFADALPGEDQLTLVRRLRQRARSVTAYMRSACVPVAEVHESHGTYFPAIAARFGADLWVFTEEWLAKLETELEASADSD